MPVQFSHCTATWSHARFHELRRRIARAVGIDLDAMHGFGGRTPWPSVQEQPLVSFLDHSDRDGQLSADECEAVAPLLQSILDGWPDGEDRRKLGDLVNGMRIAATCGEPLQFY